MEGKGIHSFTLPHLRSFRRIHSLDASFLSRLLLPLILTISRLGDNTKGLLTQYSFLRFRNTLAKGMELIGLLDNLSTVFAFTLALT